MSNKLEQLKSMTSVVADTGDIEAIARYQPDDATTNPSLVLKAAALPHYQHLLTSAKIWARANSNSAEQQLSNCCDKLAVAMGCEILKIIPGRVSTEVDARLSFDTAATIERAKHLIDLYQQEGIGSERILIKIATTWEGIRAAEALEKDGINCNLTLLFSLTQAIACAEAGAYLISPFVGRILDWYKTNTEMVIDSPFDDPGVASVSAIYNYYKQYGYNTAVMGASFRNAQEIEALAGCDRLTISPQLLEELTNDQGELKCQLVDNGNNGEAKPTALTESEFRLSLNEDAMATEKLAEGIRNFIADQRKLEALLRD